MRSGALFLAVFWLLGETAFAQQKQNITEDDPVQQTKTKGIQFVLPEDWPVEKRNGAVGPIPIEEYMALKFKKVDERIAALEKRVEAQEQGVLVKVNAPPPQASRLRSHSEDEQENLTGQVQNNQAYEAVEENVTAIN